MCDLKYIFSKIKWRFLGKNNEIINNYFRRSGIKIGVGANIYSNIMTPEPYLIFIGDNVTVSNDVQFITHDNSICKIIDGASDIFGEIRIGSNCFLGARSIIMLGVTLPQNTIVAAGAVVTKSFSESGLVIGGNPARIIGSFEQMKSEKSSTVCQIRQKHHLS